MTPGPDVVVVGAGIVGAACADAISSDGLRVLILDSLHPGGGATAAGMGHIVVMDDSEAQFALTRYSQTLWDVLADELPSTVERLATGTIWVAADDEEMDAVNAKHADYRLHGISTDVLDDVALLDAEPNLRKGLVGGLIVHEDSVVYPPAAAQWLVDRACLRGAKLRVGESASRILDGTVVLDSGECIDAGWIVNAAGIAALPILSEPIEGISIRPRKGHLVITDRYPGFCRHQLVELGYLKSAHSKTSTSVAFNLQPRATGQMLLGSSRQFDRETPEVEEAIVGAMIDRALEYMPSLADLRVVRAWTGFRAATEDKLPMIGAHPTMSRVMMAAGHEGLGITTSLATGRLVADIVAGRQSEIDRTPYAANRGGRGRDDV